MPELNIWHAIALHRILCQEGPGRSFRKPSMWKVYTEIELPLVFTLDSMENGESSKKRRIEKLWRKAICGPHS